jgi:hypothetical protein
MEKMSQRKRKCPREMSKEGTKCPREMSQKK